jgi:NDP-sugar pyrophosphorylase family protein
MSRLRAGIFAAGLGSRLGSTEGLPKGLTPVAGRPLIDWILDDLKAAGVADTVMIVNETSTALRDHVAGTRAGQAVRCIVETTASSMHSFLRVLETLADGGDEGPFLMSTIDTIAPPGTFAAFIDAAANDRADVTLALTTRLDDENPLRVEIDDGNPPKGGSHRAVRADIDTVRASLVGSDFSRTVGRVVAVGAGPHVTAGYYLVRSTVLAEATAGRQRNFGALRQFFAYLFDRGYRMTGICMPDSVDVDRPQDITAAERLLRASASRMERAGEGRAAPATKQ